MFQGKRGEGGRGRPLAQRDSFCPATSQESEQPDSAVTCVLGLETLRADHGSDEGPHVEEEADPAGRHLDPEHRPAPIQQFLNLMVIIMEPVGDGHHDVEGSQEEDKMEVGVAVDGSLSLIIHYVLA